MASVVVAASGGGVDAVGRGTWESEEDAMPVCVREEGGGGEGGGDERKRRKKLHGKALESGVCVLCIGAVCCVLRCWRFLKFSCAVCQR